jgi:hypothetical protein
MNSDRLNSWLTLAANLGVLAGIILVVVELGQNREMIRAQTRSDVAAELVELLRDVPSNPQLAEVLVQASEGGELTAAEYLQFQQRVVSMLRYFENVHYQYRQGLYDEGEFLTQQEAWKRFYGTPSETVAVWCDYRLTFSPDFREAFDALLTTSTCPTGGGS